MDKRTLIAIGLIVLIVIFYDDYINWLYPNMKKPTADSTAVAEAITEDEFRDAYSEPETKSAPEMRADIRQDSSPLPEASSSMEPVHLQRLEIPEKLVTIETDYIRVKLSSHGARIVSLEMKPNGKYLRQYLPLIPEDQYARPGFRFWTMDGEVKTADLQYELEGFEGRSSPTITLNGEVTRRIKFTTTLDSLRQFTVYYEFKGEGYAFVTGVKSDNLRQIWARDYGEAYWENGLTNTEFDPDEKSSKGIGVSNASYYSKAFVLFEGDEMENMKPDAKKEKSEEYTGNVKWAGIRSKYFFGALIPENTTGSSASLRNVVDESLSPDKYDNKLGFDIRLPFREDDPSNLAVRVYAGPLDLDYLNAVDPTLEESMSWGWAIIEPFSRLVLWSLKKVGAVIPNYGIAILIFSLLIKIVLWPLTHKSHQSMAAMSQLQPKIAELREKHGDDPQRMQKETMKMYKEEGVNPMGGCLPNLLQMPVMFGMFMILSSTIEFRRAPFMLWITDLSKPDILFHLPFSLPLYGAHVALLPIVMGITTFYQSKLTMTDPNQKIMLYFMPIFMVLMFNNFPSGLTFYYTLFNVWTILQQKLIPAHPKKPAEAAK